MKKVNFRNALLALVVTLSFVVGGVVQTTAQTSPSLTGINGGLANVPTGDFVTSTEAQNVLMAEMLLIKDEMPTQSGATLEANARLVQYYNGVRLSIESGQAVPQAIVDGLDAVRGSDASGVPTNSVLLALKQMATDLLQL